MVTSYEGVIFYDALIWCIIDGFIGNETVK